MAPSFHESEVANASSAKTPIEDTVEITQEAPYRNINFLGTYAATALGTIASYGGYVMPATSLALINADLGTLATDSWRNIPKILVSCT